MSQTIFQKIRLVVLGRAHDLLNAVIDLDSPSAIRQHIRDLEKAMDKIDESVATARGHEKTARSDFSRLEAEWRRIDRQIDAILSDGDESNDQHALPLQAKLDGLSPQVKAAHGLVETTTTLAAQLNEVRVKLQAKQQSMLSQLQTLEAMDKAAKAKEQAADSLKMLQGVDIAGGQQSVDNLARRIEERANKADARLDMALQAANSGLDADTAVATTAANLALRRARLAQAIDAESPAAFAEDKEVSHPAWMDA